MRPAANEAELARELRALAPERAWPRSPDVAGAVADRIRAADRAGEPAAPRRRPAVGRALAAALVLLLVLVAIGAAVPSVRAAVERALGIAGGARVVRVEHVPSGSALALGRPLSLTAAGRAAGFAPLVPAALGPPERVWFGGDLGGRAVSLQYGDDDTVLTEIPRASVVIAVKMIGAQVRVRRVRIGDADGLWIDRGPRTLQLPGAQGPAARRAALPGSHVLLWDGPGVALRLETRRSLAAALRIARSLPRP